MTWLCSLWDPASGVLLIMRVQELWQLEVTVQGQDLLYKRHGWWLREVRLRVGLMWLHLGNLRSGRKSTEAWSRRLGVDHTKCEI